MMINESETEIVGRWLANEGHVTADANCQRIDQLTTGYLTLLGHDASGWQALYRDPLDGRYWVRSYPTSGQHGGGPPELRHTSLQDAQKLLGIAVG
ncbi:Imm27 family immunity protein [Devosia sp. CN2-171]|uniref:Imm27 family immunity protein n=1 Tax=Devosia sp. CN2-171 TaxID=3400909 RepID=UPI003BF8CBAE